LLNGCDQDTHEYRNMANDTAYAKTMETMMRLSRQAPAAADDGSDKK
jgi:hypothetical protein